MLRLVSIIGIALAMVIGFVALSSQMKDDFTARTAVVDVIAELKKVATGSLQCDQAVEVPPPVAQPAAGAEPDVDVENPEPVSEPGEFSTGSSTSDKPETNIENIPNLSMLTVNANADGSLSLIGVFREVKGESGKTKIKAGSNINIQCRCEGSSSRCDVVSSDISNKLIPRKIDA